MAKITKKGTKMQKKKAQTYQKDRKRQNGLKWQIQFWDILYFQLFMDRDDIISLMWRQMQH